jgi:hypothetical protein
MGRLSLGVLGFLFATLFGRWSQYLFTNSELIHFSVNFPGTGRAETMACCDLGGPWARERDPQSTDYAAGGLLPWGEEGRIVVDLGKQGLPKRLLQPNFISLSSHWLRNVGTQPYRIKLDMEMCGFELEWETFEAEWDPVTHSSTRAIEPGDTFNADWFIKIPPELRDQAVVCEGQLSVSDAETGASLSELPITIINSRAEPQE